MANEIDPVCEMEVDAYGTEHSAEYNGKNYYFCSAVCRERFLENPSEYIKSQ